MEIRSSGIKLASGQQSDYTIVVSPACSPSEQYAAEELQEFLKQIAGVRLPILRTPVQGPMLLVGNSPAVGELPVDIDFEALGDEGFVIKTVGPHLVLAGGRPRGTLYACYEFLDKYLGCRWFTPEVSHIPHRDTVDLPHIDYQKIPALEYRDTDYYEACEGQWAARNRLNGHFAHLQEKHGGHITYAGFVHTFNRLVPPEDYFQEHPEYFSEIDGQRTAEQAQLCLTNPDVVEIATDRVHQWLRENPQASIVSVSQNDWYGYCQCDRCQALAEHEGSQAGPILHFVNQIADNIRDEFPDVAVDTLAYQYSRKPPKHVRPRDNVIVRLCSIECCFTHPLASCDSQNNQLFSQDIRQWAEICDRLYVWDYVTDFYHFLVPFPNLHSLQPNVKFFVAHNVRGLFEEGNSSPGGEFAQLRSYLLARCLWDPDCDWEQQMDEFLQAYYGPAAQPIAEYIEMLHQKVAQDDIHLGCCESSNMLATATSAHLTEETISAADRLFDAAEAAVADSMELLARVKAARLPVQFVKIARREEFVPSQLEYRALVNQFTEIARQSGVEHMGLAYDPPDLESWLQSLPPSGGE